MTTNQQGSESITTMGNRRFDRLNQIIEESARNVMTEKHGKGPFELTVRVDGGVIIFSTTVKENHGEFVWTRKEDLRDELKNYGIVSLVFESSDDGCEFPYNNISLDEVTNATGSDAPPTKETRKPAVAGAAD